MKLLSRGYSDSAKLSLVSTEKLNKLSVSLKAEQDVKEALEAQLAQVTQKNVELEVSLAEAKNQQVLTAEAQERAQDAASQEQHAQEKRGLKTSINELEQKNVALAAQLEKANVQLRASMDAAQKENEALAAARGVSATLLEKLILCHKKLSQTTFWVILQSSKGKDPEEKKESKATFERELEGCKDLAMLKNFVEITHKELDANLVLLPSRNEHRSEYLKLFKDQLDELNQLLFLPSAASQTSEFMGAGGGAASEGGSDD